MKSIFVAMFVIVLIALGFYTYTWNKTLVNSQKVGKHEIDSRKDIHQSLIFYETPVIFDAAKFLSNQGWAISGEELWQSKDGGISWTKNGFLQTGYMNGFGNPIQQVTEIQMLLNGKVWLLAGDMFVSKNEGLSWQKASLPGLIRSFHFYDENNGWAVGESHRDGKTGHWNAVAFKTRDGGLTWKEIALGNPKDCDCSALDVWSLSEEQAWIVGDIVIETKNGGKT